MAIVLDSSNGKVYDRTDELLVVPDANFLTSALGLFQDDPRSQKRIQIVRRKAGNHALVDRNWDERNSTIYGRERDYLNLDIPHVPADDAITPNDIDGVPAGTLSDVVELETVARVRAEKMVDLRAAHSLTLEVARMQLITEGTAYAPSGTIVTNFYDEYGVTRTSVPVTFTGTASPYAQIKTAIDASRNAITNGSAGAIRDFVVLCGSEFFSALVTNPFVVNVATYGQPSRNDILLDQPANAAGLLDARYQSVRLFGALWVDVGAGGYTNQAGTFVPFIASDEAYLLPRGVNGLLKTYYAPANRFSFVNRTAQTSYWFEYLNEKDDRIEIMTEQNFLNAVLWPDAIVQLTIA